MPCCALKRRGVRSRRRRHAARMPVDHARRRAARAAATLRQQHEQTFELCDRLAAGSPPRQTGRRCLSAEIRYSSPYGSGGPSVRAPERPQEALRLSAIPQAHTYTCARTTPRHGRRPRDRSGRALAWRAHSPLASPRAARDPHAAAAAARRGDGAAARGGGGEAAGHSTAGAARRRGIPR